MITNTAQQPRASRHTLGCRLNQAEAAVLGELLLQGGYRLVAFGKPTDWLVLNTGSVTEDAERASRYVIRKTLKHSPQFSSPSPDALRKQDRKGCVAKNG